ncbi:hypothetical protein D3C85_1393870 [compost metagenome]
MRPCVEWPVAASVASVLNAVTRPGSVTLAVDEKSTGCSASQSRCATSSSVADPANVTASCPR